MTNLGNYLGIPGTSMKTVIDIMGEPDAIITPDSTPANLMMPGPVLLSKPTNILEAKTEYLQIRYNWRGNFSYLWFNIDSLSETVLKSGWYMELVV